MDSLTQLALGAAVGEAVLGKKIGNKAMLWGGICGTLPDLDVFIPMGNAVADFTYHRSFSHSLFVLALLTPLVTWLTMKIHKHPPKMRHKWWTMVYLVFATHVLLDSFTAYGTQIFWPFFTTPMTWSTLFIIDPFYTVPLLLGLITVLIFKRRENRTRRSNLWGLALSTLYLSWSVVAKVHVDEQMRQGLIQQGVNFDSLFTTPAPFNTLLWRGVAMTDQGYYEVYYSVLDHSLPTQNAFYRSDTQLIENLQQEWDVQRLQWFSKGFYNVRQQDENVVISDLRMGLEPSYVFQFAVGKVDGENVVPQPVQQLTPNRDLDILDTVWQRIWSQDVEVTQ